MEKKIREGARRRRRPLREASSALELAVSAPGSTGPKWRSSVLTRINEVCVALEDHIVEVEGSGGFADDISAHAPRLIGMMNALNEEHDELRQMVVQLREVVGRKTDKLSKDKVAAVRKKVQSWLGRIARHQQKGADIVYEAYNVDIGGE